MPIVFQRTGGWPLILFLLFTLPVAGQLRADFTMNTSGGCSPLIVNFTNRSFGNSASATYLWDFGNGNTSTLSNPEAIYTDVNTYSITLTVKDGGQSSSATHQVSVYQQPTADFSVSSSKICANTPVTFTSLSTPGSGSIQTYYWDFGDGSTQQGPAAQSHTYTVAQLATPSLTVTNNYGCTASVLKKDLVRILPALTASFTADKKVLCLATDAVQFTNTSSGPGALSYAWDFGDGNSSTQTSPSYSFNKKGIYSVKLTVFSSEGCTAVNQQNTSLNVASYTSDFGFTSHVICEGSSAVFVENGTPVPDNTLWTLDGVPLYNSSNFSLLHYEPIFPHEPM